MRQVIHLTVEALDNRQIEKHTADQTEPAQKIEEQRENQVVINPNRQIGHQPAERIRHGEDNGPGPNGIQAFEKSLPKNVKDYLTTTEQ